MSEANGGSAGAERGSVKHEGAIGAVTDLGGKLITVLPPTFVMLVLLNVVFLGLVFWFLGSQMDQRTALVGKLLDACIETDVKHSGDHK